MTALADLSDTPAPDDEAAVRARGALRFIACGSVDDGKSTLIGRLLHEARAIFEDQRAALEKDSRRFGTTGDEIDYALLVDGLEAEREQGITIDVAYRFFSTPRRAFIVADTPGHQQYTRNMATGASGADLAVLLVDARAGLLDQTRRHAAIVGLMGVRKVVLAVNKMDLVGFDKEIFDSITRDFAPLAERLKLDWRAIPLAARHGDNVVEKSARTPWYDGPALLDWLERVEIAGSAPGAPLRMPVQWINRPNSEFRGAAGAIEAGAVSVGDEVLISGSGRLARVSRIVTLDGDLPRAGVGEAVTLVFADQVDIARGDLIADPKSRPSLSRRFTANLVVMGERTLTPDARFILKANSRSIGARLVAIDHRIDMANLAEIEADSLEMNDIARVEIECLAPLAFDPYAENHATGGFILIDAATNETVGAGMIVEALGASDVHAQAGEVDNETRARMKNQTPLAIWLTGLSGAGKSTIAALAERQLASEGYHTMILDGDNLRLGLNSDLGFSSQDRAENIRRAGEVAKLMTEAGLIVFCAFVSPFRADREQVAALFPDGGFVEVFVDAPLEACRQRDVKGLYAKAAAGGVAHMTGIGQGYEAPLDADIVLSTGGKTALESSEELVAFLRSHLGRSAATSLDSAQL